mgnify:CR=1 FL=1
MRGALSQKAPPLAGELSNEVRLRGNISRHLAAFSHSPFVMACAMPAPRQGSLWCCDIYSIYPSNPSIFPCSAARKRPMW